MDEEYLRILFLGEPSAVAEEVRKALGNATRGSFDVVWEPEVLRAMERIEEDEFDLLLFDLSLARADRASTVDLATELAQRIPVVVLTGTEPGQDGSAPTGDGIRECIENADVPGKLRATIRRARRFGTAIGVMTPIFCRIEGLLEHTGDR